MLNSANNGMINPVLTLSDNTETVLAKLGIKAKNRGSASGFNWLNSNNSELIASYCPSTNQLLAQIEITDKIQLNQIIIESYQAYLTWRMVPAPKRGELVRLIGEELRIHKKQLGLLICWEVGKSISEAEAEVQEMIDMADFAVGQSRMLYGKTMHSERELHRMYEQWHSLGIVGVISAFNFPVAVWAWNAFIACICGNSVIWRPSPKTPLCSIAVHNICSRILVKHNYPHVFSLINSDSIELSQNFIDDQRIAMISFTGSTKVGRIVATRLAARLARSLLELGGNNAIILDQSSDLKTAIPAIVFAAIGTTGQRCTTLRRLIVAETIYSQVLQMLIAAYAQIKIGDPSDLNNHMGPLIDQAAVDNYQQAITQIHTHNAKIHYGGQLIKNGGYFVQPVIVEADYNWEIVNQETFAPILYLIPYQNLAQAIAINNQSSYGLSSAIFSSNLQAAEQFLSSGGSDCGIANVNIGTSGAEIGGAFGGEKDTGGGREAGSDSWKNYMRRQSVTINYGNSLNLAQGIKFNLGV